MQSLRVVSNSCESAQHELDHGQLEIGQGGVGKTLEVLGEAAVATHPGEGALDHPTARQHLELLDRVGALDDLELPAPHFGEGVAKLSRIVAAVRPDQRQPRKELLEPLEQVDGTVPILDVGRMHDGIQQEALRVRGDMALDAFDFLRGIEADRINPHPPFSADFTL